jgi:mannitol/fructose-specific phosphotransferase system IIA component (Ntr-type)
LLLSELLTPERIRVPVLAHDKPGVLRELTRLLVDTSGGEYGDILEAVEEREGVLSTGIGFGIAIPHAKSPTISQLSLVSGRSAEPVPFEALDGEPVRLFFLLVGPEAAAGQHVKALSRIARLVRREVVRAALLQAESPKEFYDVIIDAEGR